MLDTTTTSVFYSDSFGQTIISHNSICLFIFALPALLDSNFSTSHIRFDSEESEEETTEKQHDISSRMNITNDLNSTQSSSSAVAIKQNHQTKSEGAVSKFEVIKELFTNLFMIRISSVGALFTDIPKHTALLQLPLQNPVILNSHTNFVFRNSSKWLCPRLGITIATCEHPQQNSISLPFCDP